MKKWYKSKQLIFANIITVDDFVIYEHVARGNQINLHHVF